MWLEPAWEYALLISSIPSREAWAGFVAYCELPFDVRLRCAFLRRIDHEPHPPSRKEVPGDELLQDSMCPARCYQGRHHGF
jgi:hypothetical protein